MFIQNPIQYYEMLLQYHQAQLFLASIRIDVYSHMEQPAQLHDLARKIGCSEEKLEPLLSALKTVGLIQKDNNGFVNTPIGNEFLVKSKPHYLGEILLHREQMNSLSHLEEQLFSEKNSTIPMYDFAELAKAVIPEIYATGRATDFITEINKLYPDKNSELHILDLGGGSGILAVEFVKSYPNGKAVVFDSPKVTPVTKEVVTQHGLEQRISVIEGDFNKDTFGGAYNLIVASGVLNFAHADLNGFMDRISEALCINGYLMVIGQYFNEEINSIHSVLSWLPGRMNGFPAPPTEEVIKNATEKSGLNPVREVTPGRFRGQLFQKTEGKFNE
ncbi:methyltransferase [Lacrimispora sp.]|uniref:methyltransferase n=1 Tax=Lacrimispora sp. TaxID=2719234 RepID=UPI0028A00A40|nr:methyltransferase [Lacrimispora sp.]